jgi:thiol-disulfide isomerase/thioredoxin
MTRFSWLIGSGLALLFLAALAAAYWLLPPAPAAKPTSLLPPGMSPEATRAASLSRTPEPTAREAEATFHGTLLAGTSAPLIDFNAEDFAAAQQSDKLIVLYFYANWCPICQAEFPLMQMAFNELTADNVIGFRVNFNDDETENDEIALAREHGVAYQHTKVFVRQGQQILKSPSSWNQDRYLAEIGAAVP